MKKILAFLTAALLLASLTVLTGCPAKTSTKPGPDDTVTTPYPTTINFTTARVAVTSPNLPDGWTSTVNPYTDFLKSKLNVTYTLNWEDTAYDTHLLADLTANTLPDVFNIPNYNVFTQLYNADALTDLTSDYNQYITDRFKGFYAEYPDIFKTVTMDGKLMALPSTANGYQQAMLWIRQDWLDDLNLPQPKTIDEIEATAQAFVTQDMAGNGATVGIAADLRNAFNGYRGSYSLDTVCAAMGAYPKQWMKDANGQVYYGSTAPAFKQALAKIKNWIDIGIIPSSYLTANASDIEGDVVAGNAGMWFFPWSWGSSSFLKHNKGAQLSVYNAPLVGGQAQFASGTPFEKMLGVRKGYVNSEVIFKVYTLWDAMTNGFDTDGYNALQPMRDSNTTWYAVAPLGDFAIRSNKTVPLVGQDVKAFVDNGTMPPAGSEAPRFMYNAQTWQQYLDGGSQGTPPLNAWPDYIQRYVASNYTEDNADPVNPVFFWQTPTMAEDSQTLSALEANMITTVLTPGGDINAFDQFVTDWNAAGGADATAEVQALTQ
ncbi:MAG: hypothetical protein FWF49_04150 [Oscillospiraceae bacterium]|nr:hypothetical protein [Oscillospiraceae bacterium]